MHECPDCGSMCSCDIDDMRWEEPPDDCRHRCPPIDDEDDEPCGLCAESGLTQCSCDGGPNALPVEFDDDETCDFTEEDVIT
jgi:hypothetical protein